MDASNDVIIGTACSYGWADFKNYAVSLDQSGFRGRKVLFVRNITQIARETLTTLGFELIDYVQVEANTVIQRFKLLHDWLATQTDIRYVIQCDVRDVVIQTDPSIWMEKQTAKIFGASEFILYKNEFCNPKWIEKLYGESRVEELADEHVVCAGTVAGTHDAITRLSARIYDSSTDRFGDDQAALNHLLRTEFKDEMAIPEWQDGFILTSGWWLIGRVNGNQDQAVGRRSILVNHPPQLKDGVAYPYGSDTPYCIVHQYERGQEWLPKISEHYKNKFAVPSDTTPEKKFYKIGKAKYAKDGLTIDWFDQYAIG